MDAAPAMVAIVLVTVATLALGAYGLRLSRTTSDFMVASRAVGPRMNASAISGEYLSAASFLGVAGLLLTFGADMLVDSATELARAFGVSELVIGLTIVAGGTSAPELVTSVMSTLRGKSDLSVGNVLGSCVFNILGILGITAVVVPIEVPSSVFFFDLPLMVILALACLPFFFSGGRISRIEGAVLLSIWMAYTVLLYVGWPAKSLDSDTDSSIQPPPSTTRSQ